MKIAGSNPAGGTRITCPTVISRRVCGFSGRVSALFAFQALRSGNLSAASPYTIDKAVCVFIANQEN